MTSLVAAPTLPRELLAWADRVGADLARLSASLGREVCIDPVTELTRRDVGPRADASRIVATRAGWLAVNLARSDDVDLVPAWLAPWVDPSAAATDPWAALDGARATTTAEELLARGVELGLPVAIVGERRPHRREEPAAPLVERAGRAAPRRSMADLRVLDLSSLWAGPLCGAILAAAGAQVLKVESTARPDGARLGSPRLFEHLNADKAHLAVDLSGRRGIACLRRLAADADVVIEASRPRALRHLGIDVDALLADADRPRTWVSITGYGRAEGHRVAFGDVAAAAGGLVAWDRSGAPSFLGDAIADPLSGLAAAAAVLSAVARDRAGLIDVSMADVAASAVGRRSMPEDRMEGRSRRRGRPVPTPSVVFTDVEVRGRRTSVVVAEGRIAAIGEGADGAVAGHRIDGAGAALLSGLHDHHVHLAATAARARSIDVGPPRVRSVEALRSTLAAAAEAVGPGTWIRAVGHHASVGGDLDRDLLDRFVPDRPLRVQDATGARWTVNSLGAEALGLDDAELEGIERDRDGRPTGRLHRLDEWLRSRLPEDGPLPFADLGRQLASWGITGVTDATPYASPDGHRLLAGAVRSGALPQRVTVTGGIELAGEHPPAPLLVGPVKLVVDDGGYPSLAALTRTIGRAHAAGRSVAVHCVTRVALVLTLAAFDVAGSGGADRIEHGSVIPLDLVPAVRAHRLTVVTQPSFVAERGDRYLAEVDDDDVEHLYRCRSLLDAGVRVAGGTDSPHGDGDPWRSVAAAVQRTTRSGEVLGGGERLGAARALELFLGPPGDPGGPARRIEVGAPADLCLLHVPLVDALRAPSSSAVRLTLAGGRVCFGDA